QVVDAAAVGRADVHTRAFADSIQPFEVREVVSPVQDLRGHEVALPIGQWVVKTRRAYRAPPTLLLNRAGGAPGSRWIKRIKVTPRERRHGCGRPAWPHKEPHRPARAERPACRQYPFPRSVRH